MTYLTALRYEHRPLGDEPDQWCHSCTGYYPCDVTLLLDVYDSARVIDRHYGRELAAKYPYGWALMQRRLDALRHVEGDPEELDPSAPWNAGGDSR